MLSHNYPRVVGAVSLGTCRTANTVRVLARHFVMPLTAAQIRGALTSSPWTKDFLHLQPFPLNHLKRFSFKDISVKATKPKDRIKYWNIIPGDRVRIIGDKDGRLLEVAKINKISNRVYLKGATAKVRRVPRFS